MLAFYGPLIKRLISIGKKIFLVLVVYTLVITAFMYFFNKDKPVITVDPIKRNREQIYKVINNQELQKTKEGKAVVALYRMMTCGFMGEGCTKNPQDGNILYKKSFFGFLTNIIILPLQNPPSSGLYWAYSGLQNAGFVPHAYAYEGIGFSGLRPIMNIWKAFRDIAYMILVIILIAIGFMIMFRMKLNAQTVISVENALPRIVIALILITFSFAIAGFLIDLIYIIITVGISALSLRSNFYNPAEMQNKYMNPGFGDIWGSMFPTNMNSKITIPGTNFEVPFVGGIGTIMMLSQSFVNLLPSAIDQILRTIISLVFWIFLIGRSDPIHKALQYVGQMVPDALLGPIIGFLAQVGWDFFVLTPFAFWFGFSYLFPLIITLLISLTIGALFFRIFFLLFATYLRILLLVVFAPIILLFEAIPGKNAFSFWFKSILADILIFPLVVLLFVITYVIVNSQAFVGGLWKAPFLGDVNPQAFQVLLGFGIMFQIPTIVKTFKEFLGVKGLPVGIGLGTYFGGATGVGGAGMGLVGQIGSLSLGLSALTGKNLNELLSGKKPQSCLPGSTLINILRGKIPIRKLQKGDKVWTTNIFGARKISFILAINKIQVPSTHTVIHLLLDDKRRLVVSGLHPTADGRVFAQLHKGDFIDGAFITQIKQVRYRNKYTYDILPSGETGNYWANNILIGSTLFQKTAFERFRSFVSRMKFTSP